MARIPGTETPVNRSGWTPGLAVRCRRSRANGSRGLADRRGFVCEVRHNRVCVLLDARGRTVWLESEAVVAEPDLADPELELVRAVMEALGGQRLAFEDDEIVVFSESFAAEAVDRVRSLLGDRLVSYAIDAHGVHEVATRLRIALESRAHATEKTS